MTRPSNTSTEQAYEHLVSARRRGDVAALSELALDESVTVIWRSAAIDALGKLQNPSALEVLQRVVRSPDRAMRVSATTALGRLGARDAEPLLTALLNDDDTAVAAWAAWSLGRLGRGTSADALIAALEFSQWPIRIYAARALARIGERRAFAPVRSLWRRETWRHKLALLPVLLALLRSRGG